MKRVVAVLAALLLFGCQNLPSSALIYGNKTVYGIGIEKDASGNPIPGFNLGYVSHNFARVPVAVKDGETVELIWGATCPSEPQPCMPFGDNGRVLVARVANMAQVTRKTVPEVIALLSGKLTFLGSTTSLAFFEVPDGQDEAAVLKNVRDTVAAAFVGLGTSAADSKITADQNITVRATSDLVRRDALSVFGSFDARGSKDEATLGQVFATGVAAQIVSEAATDVARARLTDSVRACIESATKAPTAQQADAMKTCLVVSGGQ